MTARDLYEGVLIELNKENAPNILLEDFNYFANKAINNYINKRYNIYDINQQTTDDLRVLKATALLTPRKIDDYKGLTMAGDDNMATYEVIMPSDYLHILNCICIYNVRKTYKCYNAGDTWRSPAKRLTADMYSQVLDNFWNKPSYKNPYYYIHNVNTEEAVPTNPFRSQEHYSPTQLPVNRPGSIKQIAKTGWVIETITYTADANFEDNGKYTVTVTYQSCDQEGHILDGAEPRVVSTEEKKLDHPLYAGGTDSALNKKACGYDGNENVIIQGEGLPKTITIGGEPVSNVERGLAIRYGNVSQVRLEIRYGTDTQVFDLKAVYIDYIKAPQNIRLTQREIDLTEDTSQMLEYPDYVCQEIINELVHLVMENISDQRLQTHPVVSLSIANPAQAQAPEAAGQTAQ